MASNTNKFLAPTLQNSATTRGSATFIDNRVQTATPTPFIETITPGKNQLQGFVGTVDSKGRTVPEPNAYIYIYINGFLINPPKIGSDGTFNKNDNTAIISDSTGHWQTKTFFFDTLPAFQFGQTITFKAKAPLKQVSNRSVPYAIGGTPTPIELGIFGDGGILRPPYEGESSLMGRISYWFGNLPEQLPDANNKVLIPGTVGKSLFDCSNHLYVYIDGMHVGSSTGVLGEVFPNEIRGTNAVFPIFTRLSNTTLSLIVDKNQVDIPLVNIQPIDKAALLGIQDSVNTSFIFLEPDDNLAIKVFNNGIRFINGIDFRIFIDGVTKQGTVTFTVPPAPGDNLSVLFQYEAGSFILEEPLGGIVDGLNNIFNLGTYPRAETVEIYQNGIHLIQGIDYLVNGTTITFNQIPDIGSLLIADYQPSTAKTQFVFIQTPNTLPNGTFSEFIFTTPSIIGNPHVFKNGILQQEGLFFDYTVVNNKIVFTPWSIPEEGDTLLIAFYVASVLLEQMVDYLNQSQQFKDNCLTANTLNIKPIDNLINIQRLQNGENIYFTLPLTDVPANLRLFKNGVRLKELDNNNIGDYFLDYEKSLIVLSVPSSTEDTLVGLFNYITSNFVVGEVPSGLMDGTNVTFTLSMIPKVNTVQVFYNGIRLNPFGNHPDYSVNQNNITFLNFVPIQNDTIKDIILVDYEISFGFQTFTSAILPTGQTNGFNADFSFQTPNKGTAINVFVNGLLQQPGFDYNLERNKVHFYNNSIPQYGDIVLLEFNDAGLFTNNPNNQLRISSPYTLDIKRYPNNTFDFAEQLLFGSDVELYPGKDEDNEFRFWFNSRTGYWKWTWYDPSSGVTTPFTAGQRITARVKNDKPFIYTIKR